MIEAADTGPFFHNNSVDTIEEAVGFYNSNAFNTSPLGAQFKRQDTGGIGIHLETTQVESVAALLRVLNALENIRSSSELDQAAVDLKDKDKARCCSTSPPSTPGTPSACSRSGGCTSTRWASCARPTRRSARRPAENSRPRRDELIAEILQLKAEARAAMVVTP